MVVETIHGVGGGVRSSDAGRLELSPGFTVYDESDGEPGWDGLLGSGSGQLGRAGHR